MAFTFKHGDRPLDDYTVQRGVGRGGFGEVYYAISDGGREVALKYLRDNPQIELRGVSHCINLKSPHLVTIFDVRKNADGEYFIIMEYVSGPSLRDLLIAEPDGIGVQKAAFFMRELAKGLGYLHDRGIVHRDLKPGNIFYDDGYVKIGDYGLSKFISVSRHSAQTTSVGTVHYMAPEVGSGSYSRGIDIYALGVMLYEMLLGKVPFEGSSMGEVLMKHLTAQPEVDELPAPFGDVIRKALAKDPNERYQTVGEMVEDIFDTEGVRNSLAGFNPTSLSQAAACVAGDFPVSPVPSPNPPPAPRGDDVAEAVLPGRVVRRVQDISDKVARKIDALGRKAGKVPPPPPAPVSTPPPVAMPATGKGVLLALFVAAGIAIGNGVLFGVIFNNDQIGLAAFGMTIGLPIGLALAQRVTRWAGSQAQPEWVQRLIRAICCAPVLLVGGLAVHDAYGVHINEGGVVIGLGAALVLVDWKKQFQSGATGELKLSHAFSAGLCAFVVALFVSHGGPWLAGGVAAAVSLIVQAAAWFWPTLGSATPWVPGDRPRHGWRDRPRHGWKRRRPHVAPGSPPTGPGTPRDQKPVGPSLPIDPKAARSTSMHWRLPLVLIISLGCGFLVFAVVWSVSHGDENLAWAALGVACGLVGMVQLLAIRQRRGAAPPRRPEHERGQSSGIVSPEGGAGPLPRPAPGAPPFGIPIEAGHRHAKMASMQPLPPLRWGVTRAFWTVVAFCLFGGAVVTFLLPVLGIVRIDEEQIRAIVGCIACVSFLVFALSKTTQRRRQGFWRETARPFLIACALTGIGAALTFLSIHGVSGPDEQLAVISALVMSGVLLVLSLYIGHTWRLRSSVLLLVPVMLLALALLFVGFRTTRRPVERRWVSEYQTVIEEPMPPARQRAVGQKWIDESSQRLHSSWKTGIALRRGRAAHPMYVGSRSGLGWMAFIAVPVGLLILILAIVRKSRRRRTVESTREFQSQSTPETVPPPQPADHRVDEP